jgi:acylphosphatase
MASHSDTDVTQTRRTVRVRIEGRVQGVGYRAFVEQHARAHAIDGSVRNRRDGGVEALLSGPSTAIDAIIEHCRQGPRGARVDWLHVDDVDLSVATGFRIEPTF